MFKELLEDLTGNKIEETNINKDTIEKPLTGIIVRNLDNFIEEIDKQKQLQNNIDEQKILQYTPFDISKFEEELKLKSETKNKSYLSMARNISAYNIAHDCISSVVKSLLNYPIPSYADSWLPVMMRHCIGESIHNFIQKNSNQFTEGEISLKVPSIQFSGRIDNLIGPNILVEIKSCTFEDYNKVIKDKKPRLGDFYQLMVYKYIIENYLHEIKTCGVKTRTQLPVLDKYNIDKLQVIYVAHDLCSSDIDSISDAMKFLANLKKMFNSSSNKFFFINSILIDINSFDPTPYLTWIANKINRINLYVNSDRLPPADDEFVDKKKCFFCQYNLKCEIRK